jgi:hypothetical protein
LLVLHGVIVLAQEKQGHMKRFAVKIFAMQNGEIVEMQNEPGFDVLETAFELPSLIPSTLVASSKTTVHSVRLTGEKSKVRFPQGSGFNFLSEFSSGIDARSLQLLRFGKLGKQRITYTRPWGDTTSGGRSIWNTIAFKVTKQKDGKWVLLPPDDLPTGEYCFTLVNTPDNFCFGVDPRS